MHLLVQIVKELSHEILIVITLVWARECFRLRDTDMRAYRQEGCLAVRNSVRNACRMTGRLAGWRQAGWLGRR